MDVEKKAHVHEEPEHDQHDQPQEQAVVARGNEQHDRGNPDRLDEVGADQHIAAAPSIKQDTCERPDDRVGQQQDRKCRGDLDGVGLTLRREQHEGRQGRLNQPVGELSDEAYAEEPTKVPGGKELTQGRQCHHARTLSAPTIGPRTSRGALR